MPIQYSPRFSLAPYPVQAVTDDFVATARRVPDKIALIDGITGVSYTFGNLLQAATGLAGVLQDDGIEPSDRVAIVAPNSCEWVVAFIGSLFCGASVTTLNPLYTAREVGAQFEDSRPKAVFLAEVTAETVGAVWGDKPSSYLMPDVWRLAHNARSDPKGVSFDPEKHIAVLPYSSGTTGAPKGVMLSHYNVTTNIRQWLGAGLIDSYSVLVNYLPFFHIYGMAVLMLSALATGATHIVLPRFGLPEFLDAIKRFEVTNLFVVPPVMLELANAGPEADLSSVRFILSGAAPLPIDLARRVTDRFDVEVVQGFGMTEASPVTHATILGRDKPGSVGPLVADTRQKVIDPATGDEVPIGEPGELLVSGPQVMQGYFERPDATAETLIDADDGRWLRTGDIVTADDEGYVTVRDRAKEMIKYKGYQIAPAELEALLLEHPDIADAAVIPKDTASADGEVPKAFVVIRDGATLSEKDVIAHVTANAAPYKKVREVEFVDEIPKTASGKILRRQLKEAERVRHG